MNAIVQRIARIEMTTMSSTRVKPSIFLFTFIGGVVFVLMRGKK